MNFSDVKINRIKSENKVHMDLLTDVLSPETLAERIPRLGEVAEARVAHRNRLNTIRELGHHRGSNLHYVAQVDISVWAAVLAIFAKYDEETGEFMDDGLLYKTDHRGNLVINKDFFYALMNGPLKNYDMRGNRTLMV